MKKNLIILTLIFFVVVGGVTVLMPNFIISYKTGKIAQAAGSGSSNSTSKVFFGGKISKFSICTLDPQPSATTCNVSCKVCSPIVNKILGPSSCVGFDELIYETETTSSTGKKEKKEEMLCPPKGTVYLGIPPRQKANFIGFGLSKLMPLLIYISPPSKQ